MRDFSPAVRIEKRRQRAAAVLFAVVCAASEFAFSCEVLAQNVEPFQRARAEYEAGVEAMAAQRFSDAVASFERSLAIRSSPVVMFNLALAYREAGRATDACTFFARYLRNPEPSADSERLLAVRDELGRLRETHGIVEIATRPSNAVVSVDGVPSVADLPTCHAPGTVLVRATAAGRVASADRVEIVRAERLRLQISLDLAEPPRRASGTTARSPTRALAPSWIFATGAAAVGSFAAALVLQLVTDPYAGEYSATCAVGQRSAIIENCNDAYGDLVRRQIGIVALDVVSGIAAVTTAFGAGLWMAGRPRDSRPSVRVVSAGAWHGLQVEF